MLGTLLVFYLYLLLLIEDVMFVASAELRLLGARVVIATGTLLQRRWNGIFKARMQFCRWKTHGRDPMKRALSSNGKLANPSV